jgi:hypothetical protein
MPDEDLIASWERTRGHLARAWVELPPGDGSSLEWYQEYVDHNELGLAMEALAAVGSGRGAAGPFWLALADTADEMKLTSEATKYQARARLPVQDGTCPVCDHLETDHVYWEPVGCDGWAHCIIDGCTTCWRAWPVGFEDPSEAPHS